MTAMLGRRAAPLLWLAVFACLYGVRLLDPHRHLSFLRRYVTGDLGLRGRGHHLHGAYSDRAVRALDLSDLAALLDNRRGWPDGVRRLCHQPLMRFCRSRSPRRPPTISSRLRSSSVCWPGSCVPDSRHPHDVRAMRVGVVAVSLSAVADNLRGMGGVAFPGPELEPFGFTILIGCLCNHRGQAGAGRRRAAGGDQSRAGDRPTNPVLAPAAAHARVSGLTIAARYRPMTAVAGDFYDFLELDAKRLGILIADVSGHGVPAALIASMVKVALAAQRDHADHPAAVLAGMNDVLCGQLAGQYVTAAYLFIDTESRLIRTARRVIHRCCARCERPDRVQEVEENGLILGFAEQQLYGEVEAALRANERFLLYTDGMIEASDANDDFLGIERLKEIVAAEAAG